MTSYRKKGSPDILWDLAQLTFTNLAGLTVVKVSGGLVLKQGFRILKSEILASITGWATETTDGPLIFGLTENHISVTEVKEVLEMIGPQEPQDNTETEKAQRYVHLIGQMSVGNQFSVGQPVLLGDDGLIVIDHPKWSFHISPAGSGGFTYFLYNLNGSAMNSESKTMSVLAKHYGVWLD